jgi:glycosyltransferase involved in cell wall biosynthesis
MSTQTAGTRERSAHNEPRVSVVTIFFNGEQFLEKAIRSVFDQTFTDWELLLVDDGSTDRSGELARRLAARHPDRIRYLSHPGLVNLGMSASRNLGLRRARGEYIAFRDADDVYLPEKLDRQVSALDEHPHVGMVYSKTLCWYSWTSEASDLDIPRKLGVATGTVIHPPDLIPLYLRHAALTPATCSVLLRRSAALQVGGFEFQFRGMYEDQVFFF